MALADILAVSVVVHFEDTAAVTTAVAVEVADALPALFVAVTIARRV
jgi:hypothetical protein